MYFTLIAGSAFIKGTIVFVQITRLTTKDFTSGALGDYVKRINDENETGFRYTQE